MSDAVRFAPYRAEASSRSRADVFAECDAAMYQGYTAQAGEGAFRAYPLYAYEELLDAVAAMPQVEVVTLEELCLRPGSPDRVRLSLRHDVDGDLVAALALAELEARRGLPSSFYLLHTAAYYGRFSGGVFHRHESMVHVYRRMQELGHEIALHADGLSVYQQHGMDGGQAVEAEIGWLRDNGLEVRGSVAHGSTAAFGAENFEIFRDRIRPARRKAGESPVPGQLLWHQGRPARLHVVDGAALGLTYEGNEIFWQKDVPVEYGATRTVDGWRWNRHLGLTGLAGRVTFCPQERVIADLARLEPGCCVVLTVHPCYYGARDLAGRPPVRWRRRIETEVNPRLGWRSYRPDTMQLWNSGDARAYQTVQASNALGLLDEPPLPRSAEPGTRLLFVGSGPLDGREVGIPAQLHRILARRCAEEESLEVATRKLAFPEMGAARLWPWLRDGLRDFQPDAVLLGIGTRELRDSLPAVWSRETGFSRAHPPGDHLDWRGEGIVPVLRSVRWRSRSGQPRTLVRWPGASWPIEEAMGREEAPRIGPIDAWAFLSAVYAHLAETTKAAGATPVLLLLDDGDASGWGAHPEGAALRQRFRARVEALADEVGLPLVDPLHALSPQPDGVPTRFPDGAWRATGHERVARAVRARLGELGLLATPAAERRSTG